MGRRTRRLSRCIIAERDKKQPRIKATFSVRSIWTNKQVVLAQQTSPLTHLVHSYHQNDFCIFGPVIWVLPNLAQNFVALSHDIAYLCR